MKLLLVADWHGKIYAEAFYNGFKKLGIETYKFSWKEYFKHYQYAEFYATDNNIFKSIYYKFQNKYLVGPVLKKINNDLLRLVKEILPDLVFIYRGTHIYPETLKQIKIKTNALIFGYNNDDPFSDIHPKYLWRYFIKCLPYYDHIFAYRPKNIKDYLNLGFKKVSILMPYYVKEFNYPIKKIQHNCDVIFIGHYEPDGRDDAIKLLIENDINVKLYGTGWKSSKFYRYFLKKLGSIKPIYGDKYNVALNLAKIALAFFSKINNDVYTRRCFEIPATKTMMISEYTDEMNRLFREGIEAEYFRNHKELLKKVKYYLSNPEKIKIIAEAGYKRLLSEGHEVTDRCRQIINVYQGYICQK